MIQWGGSPAPLLKPPKIMKHRNYIAYQCAANGEIHPIGGICTANHVMANHFNARFANRPDVIIYVK